MKGAIVFVVHIFDKVNIGGVLKVVTNVANELSRYGFSVEILSLGKIEERPFALQETITVREVGIEKYDTRHFQGLCKMLWFIKTAPALKNFINSQYRDDTVFITTSPPLSLLFALLKLPNKVVGCDHTSTVYKLPQPLQLFRNTLLRRLDKMIGLTKEDVQYYTNRRIDSVWIPNFIDREPEFEPYERTSIVFIGRFSEEKNPMEALKIYAESMAPERGVKFKLYGYGELEEKLIEYIHANNLGSFVEIIHGVTEPKEMLDNAICLILTSSLEGFGMVLLEANSLGVPILSYDAGYGPKSIVKKEINGYLVAKGNRSEFVQKLNAILTGESKFESVNVKGAIEEFYKDKVLKKWINLLEKYT